MKFLFSLDRCRHTCVSSVCRDTSCHPHRQASQSAGFVRGQTHRFQVWGARTVLARWVRTLFSAEFNPLDAIDGVCYLLPTSRNKDNSRNLTLQIKEPYLNETQGTKMWLIKSYAVRLFRPGGRDSLYGAGWQGLKVSGSFPLPLSLPGREKRNCWLIWTVSPSKIRLVWCLFFFFFWKEKQYRLQIFLIKSCNQLRKLTWWKLNAV